MAVEKDRADEHQTLPFLLGVGLRVKLQHRQRSGREHPLGHGAAHAGTSQRSLSLHLAVGLLEEKSEPVAQPSLDDHPAVTDGCVKVARSTRRSPSGRVCQPANVDGHVVRQAGNHRKTVE